MSVDLALATAWAQASLESGSPLSALVSYQLSRAATAFAIVPKSATSAVLEDHSRSIDPRQADQLLGEYLLYRSSVEVGILVVEDDTAREGDPGLDGVVTIGDRVLRWLDLHSDPLRLTQLVRTGASGYPLNAFICDELGRTILTRAEKALTEDELTSLARSARAILNAVYDAESYVVVELGTSDSSGR